MKNRIKLLKALNNQQTQMLNAIYAVEQKIEDLEKQIQKLNDTNEFRIICDNTTPGEVLLRLRRSDHTNKDVDTVQRMIRAILQRKLQDCRDRLQRTVETEELRLADILIAHGNTELSSSASEIQDTGNQEG